MAIASEHRISAAILGLAWLALGALPATAAQNLTPIAGEVDRTTTGSVGSQAQVQQATPGEWWERGEADPIVHLVVSVPDQRISVFADGRFVAESNVSTGKRGYATPKGIFSILQKARHHRSNLYSGAPMPFMQRLTWSGVALHASNSVPDYPASHGCIRLPHQFAGHLFKLTELGAQVVVTNKIVNPREFSHPQLFRAPARNPYAIRPTTLAAVADDSQSDAAMSMPAALAKPARVLITRRTGRERLMDVQRLLNELDYDAGDVDGYMGPNTWKAISRFQEDYGHEVTGKMSDELPAQLHRATGRSTPANGQIYVRRGQKDVYSAPVIIREPQRPLGVHHFTFIDGEETTGGRRWLAITLQSANVLSEADEGELKILTASTSGQALDRIEMSLDVRRHIAAMINHGSTVAISDDGISHETGKGTDFVVLTQ